MPRQGEPFSIGKVRVHHRGKWWHASYTVNGKRHRKALKVTNKEHAEARAQEIYELLREGNYTALTELETNRHVTFADFLERFRQDFDGWSESTWDGNRALLSKLEVEFGPLPLNTIVKGQPVHILAGIQVDIMTEALFAFTPVPSGDASAIKQKIIGCVKRAI